MNKLSKKTNFISCIP